MAKTLEQRQHAEAVRWIEEPIYWARTFGGAHFDPWSGQEQFWIEYGKLLGAKLKRYKNLPLTEEEQRYAKKLGISIMAGQGVGKGATISLCGLHYLFALQAVRPKVMCTAPAGPQLHSSLWPEFGAWMQRNPILGELFEKQSNRIFLKEDGKRGESSRIEPRTVQPHANPDELKVVLAGIHALGVMYQIDEASGVQDAVMEPIEGGMTDPLSMAIIIFNPTKRDGFAMETHRKNREMWVCLHWDGEELRKEKLANPGRFAWFNEDAQIQLARKYGVDSNFYRVRVRGLPPNQSTETLIGYDDAMAATERAVTALPHDPLCVAVDVAGEGAGDKSIVLTLQGPVMTGLKEFPGKNTVQLGDVVAGQVRTELMNLPMDVQFQIGVDTIGIGRGVYFHLTDVQRLRHVHMLDVSQKALDERRFHRLRDQMWWELREAFVETREIVILNDDELIGQLTSIKWGEVDGKIKIQGKGNSSGIPGVAPLSSSPDKADALAMAWWLYKHLCSRMPEGAVAKRARRARTQPLSWKVR